MDIKETKSPFHGVIYNNKINKWIVFLNKEKMKQVHWSVEKYGDIRAKLICCQMYCTKLVEENIEYKKEDIELIFNDLKNK